MVLLLPHPVGASELCGNLHKVKQFDQGTFFAFWNGPYTFYIHLRGRVVG